MALNFPPNHSGPLIKFQPLSIQQFQKEAEDAAKTAAGFQRAEALGRSHFAVAQNGGAPLTAQEYARDTNAPVQYFHYNLNW